MNNIISNKITETRYRKILLDHADKILKILNSSRGQLNQCWRKEQQIRKLTQNFKENISSPFFKYHKSRTHYCVQHFEKGHTCYTLENWEKAFKNITGINNHQIMQAQLIELMHHFPSLDLKDQSSNEILLNNISYSSSGG